MNEMNLPKDILERVEKRWASRLPADAPAWRKQRPVAVKQPAINPRGGSTIPMERSVPAEQRPRGNFTRSPA